MRKFLERAMEKVSRMNEESIRGLLRVLADEDLNVDYLYTFLDKLGGEAVVILRVDNPDFAKLHLEGKGFQLLSQDDFIRI